MVWFDRRPSAEPKNEMDDDWQPTYDGPPLDEDGEPMVPDMFEPGVWHRATNTDADRADWPDLWRGSHK